MSLWRLPNLYTCNARVIFSGDPKFVEEVSTNHLAGRNNNDVNGILIQNLNLGFIPGNISNFFPNLHTINAVVCGITEIKREDIKSFRKLQQFDVDQNNIREIPNGFFEENLDLLFISFSNNPMRHIAHNVFDHLNSLERLHFGANFCINTYGQNRTAVLDLMFRVAVNCPPTFEMIFERTAAKILYGTELEKKIDEQVSERINPLVWSVMDIDQRVKELESRKVNIY